MRQCGRIGLTGLSGLDGVKMMRIPVEPSSRTLFSILIGVVLCLLVVPGVGYAESEPAWLGIYIGPNPPASENADETVAITGVSVAGVVTGSPAEKAGIRARDRITSVNGRPIESFAQLKEVMGDSSASQWISFSVERAGEQLELDARLAGRPSDTRGLAARKGWIGARSIDLPKTLRAHFGAPGNAGVMIADIATDSPAYISGLEIGDVVYEIDGEPVRSSRDFAARIDRGGIDNTVLIVLVRSGVQIELEMTIVQAPEKRREPADESS
jgi:S1-C subfamily serine protease